MNRAVLAGVRNWPNCDFRLASVFLDNFNLDCSTDESNGGSLGLHFYSGPDVGRYLEINRRAGRPLSQASLWGLGSLLPRVLSWYHIALFVLVLLVQQLRRET